MDIVRREREIWVTWCGRPRIEGERDLAGDHVHTLADPFFCNVCTPKYFGPKGFAVRDVLLGKGWSAELEETTKPPALNQTCHARYVLALTYGCDGLGKQ